MKALLVVLLAVFACAGCGGDDFTAGSAGSIGTAASAGFGSAGGTGGSAGGGTGGTVGATGAGSGGSAAGGTTGSGGAAGASGSGGAGGSGGGEPPKCAASAAFKISALPQSFDWTSWTREFQGVCASCQGDCATVKLTWFDLPTGDLAYKWTSSTTIEVYLEFGVAQFLTKEGPCGSESDCTMSVIDAAQTMTFDLAPTTAGWKVTRVIYAGHASPEPYRQCAAEIPYGTSETMTAAQEADLYPLLVGQEFACP